MYVISIAQTWFGRSTARPRSRYGYILCPGAGLVIVTPDPRHPRRFQADFPLIGLSDLVDHLSTHLSRLAISACPRSCRANEIATRANRVATWLVASLPPNWGRT